jgi:hypothetical protein
MKSDPSSAGHAATEAVSTAPAASASAPQVDVAGLIRSILPF